ncbi:MAG: hypothetical protein ACFFDC_16705 [Promethearchaeota archaeon]
MPSMWIKDTFLTENEIKVLNYFKEGKDTAFIAKQLNVTRARVYAVLGTLNKKKIRSINTTDELQDFSYERKSRTARKKLTMDDQILRIMIVGQTASYLLENIAVSFFSQPSDPSDLGLGRVQFDDVAAIVFSVDSEEHQEFNRYSSKMHSIIRVSERETEEGLKQILREVLISIQESE